MYRQFLLYLQNIHHSNIIFVLLDATSTKAKEVHSQVGDAIHIEDAVLVEPSSPLYEHDHQLVEVVPKPQKANLFGNGRKLALGFLPRVKPRPPATYTDENN